jgi:(p)ppGpp synthase/HD superfamily hydrolase
LAIGPLATEAVAIFSTRAAHNSSPSKQGITMKTWQLTCFQKAAAMAAEAHAGQNVKTTRTPFVAHPVRVALAVMLAFRCDDVEVIAAALLHDTLEKTPLKSAGIGEVLGLRVLDLVMAMTKRGESDETAYWQRLRRGVWEARLIKMADALDHLDCTLEELPRRVDNARKALALAFSDEEAMVRARRILGESLKSAEARMFTIWRAADD